MGDITIEVAEGAAPFVLGVSTILKRAAADRSLAKRLRKMRGVLALRSSVDAQKATVLFGRGHIVLSNGLAENADVVITMNPNDTSAKPKVKGAARHLSFALNLAKVMEPPTGTWQEEAARFWDFASSAPRMPSRLRVVCTDDGSEETFGNGNGSTYEIHGTTAALEAIFTGSSIIGEVMLSGGLRVVGSFEHASILTGRSIAWALGEGR